MCLNPYPCPHEISCYTQIDYSETKRCIDLQYSNAQNGTNLWLYKDNGTNAQKWFLESVNWTKKSYYMLYIKYNWFIIRIKYLSFAIW